MNKFISGLVLVLMLLIVLFYLVTRTQDNAISYEYARTAAIEAEGRTRAMVIQAQAESRLHTAQAVALTLAATLPWGVLGVVGLLGLAVVGLLGLMQFPGRSSSQPKLIIERQIVYLPAPGQRRAEIWQALQASREDGPLLITTGRKRNEA